MQVFKVFLKTAKKSLPSVLLYFFIFSVIALAMSNVMGSGETSSFRAVQLTLGVIDEDDSAASHALTDYLSSMHEIIPEENDASKLLDRLFYREFDYILILPKGFEENLLAGKEKLFETVQIPGVYSSMFVDEQINTYLKAVRIYLTGGISMADAVKSADDALAAASNHVEILSSDDGKEASSKMTGLYYYFHFLPYVILSIILLGVTPILSAFWSDDLAKRISCSSLSLISRNLQLALGSVLYCFAVWLLFLVTAGIFYRDAFFSDQALLGIINSFLLLPLGAAISLIISAFTPTSGVLNMINNVLSLGMSFLCGVFVPQQLLGENVLAIGKYLPFYWYIKNNDLIFSFSGGAPDLSVYRTHLLIELLFVVAAFSIALVTTKYKTLKRKA